MINQLETFKKLKGRLENLFPEFAQELLSDIAEIPIFNNLIDDLGDYNYKKYSSLNFYFCWQLNQIRELSWKLEESKKSQREEIIFDFWNNSDLSWRFAEIFEKDIAKAHDILLIEFYEHLVNFIKIHLLGSSRDVDYRYFPIEEIGDEINFPKLPINNEYPIQLLMVKGSDFINQGARIAKALDQIKSANPKALGRILFFTQFIHPLKEENLVSYSAQYLPGYSSINLFNRDDIDLMDDLVHETGHHHLNLYLNLEDLIEEDPETIYYSPWRDQLRPLRGIYHAYFTFFWAADLFASLIKAKSISWTSEQRNKIQRRFAEEYLMLNYSFVDLKKCFQKKLISQKGWQIIEELNNLLNENKPLYESLPIESHGELEALLNIKKKQYQSV